MFVLSNGSIKKQFATSLAAALLLLGMGATVAGARPLSDAPESKESATAITDPAAIASNSPDSKPNSGSNDGSAASADLRHTSNILVHAYEIDGRRAATLYVKNIPLLTFLGTEVGSLSNSSDAVSLAASNVSGSLAAAPAPAGDILDPNLELDPILRASTLGEQLDSGEVDASEISVRWNEESKGYVVTLAGKDLVSLDGRTILADTTKNPAEDALQVTNRLRRLIGNAAPVSEIEGRPKPKPVAEVNPVQQVAIVSSNTGSASWYGPGFDGRRSASGEVFNQYALTAAHRTLPFGTKVLVTNLYNGRQVTVRINDRGPYSGDRVIDLSAGAADAIGLTSSGVATVQLDVLAN